LRISVKNRKIGYTYGSVSGIYSFRKEKTIKYESLLEKDFIHLMNFNDRVLDITEQPFTIEYKTKSGKTNTYTPDFLIEFKQPSYLNPQKLIKPLLVEVKPSEKILKDWIRLKPKFKQAIKLCKEKEYHFKIFNESRIRSQELRNIIFLNRYKDYNANYSVIEQIIDHLKLIGNTTVEYLIVHLFTTDLQKGNAIAHIWFLINSRIITCDLTQKLTNNTVLWLNEHIDKDIGIEI
jgi:hypothetical protein